MAQGLRDWLPAYTSQVGSDINIQKSIQEGVSTPNAFNGKSFDIDEDGFLSEVEVSISDPAKLRLFGLPAQKGDMLSITSIGNNAFKLLNVRTGKNVVVAAGKGGRLELRK